MSMRSADVRCPLINKAAHRYRQILEAASEREPASMMFDHPLGAADRLRDQRRTAWIPPRAHATSTASLNLGAWLERFLQDVLQHRRAPATPVLKRAGAARKRAPPAEAPFR
jgi:hypothetical protein